MAVARAITTLLLGLSLFATAHAEDWQYTMRPGDDLWSIAAQYCGSSRVADAIAKHNEVPDPTSIRAGTRISIPVQWLVFEPAAARILQATEGVSRINGEGNYSAARAGETVNMGETLLTLDGSALVQFADGSTITLLPQSKVLFNKLTMFGPAGMVDTHLRFSYGRGEAEVAPQNQGDRFRIQTPEGIAAVRGTRLRVGRPEGQPLTNSETLTGLVEFRQPGANTPVPGGYGAAASAGGLTTEALLAPPVWQSTAAVYGTDATLSWQPVAKAARYVLTWAPAATPGVIVNRTVSPTSQAAVPVSPGAYTVTVRGVSASGIEGMDAHQTLTVRSRAPDTQAALAADDGTVTLSWQHPDDTSYTVTVTEAATGRQTSSQTRAQTLTLPLPPGDYRWHVATEDSVPSEPQTFSMAPAAVEDIRVERRDRQLEVRWQGNPDTERYIVHLTPDKPGAEALAFETTDPAITLEAPAYGRYHLRIVAQQRNLQSTVRSQTIRVHRTPWWLLLFVAPLLAL